MLVLGDRQGHLSRLERLRILATRSQPQGVLVEHKGDACGPIHVTRDL
jgi:hypothetical protein